MFYECKTFVIYDMITYACLNRITPTRTKNNPQGENKYVIVPGIYINILAVTHL